MLDNLDLNLSLDKSSYEEQIETLMRQMRTLQQSCWEQKLPIIIVLEGWAAAGKGNLVKKIINYMDPRGFKVHPILAPTSEEKKYPLLWRFWQKLPPKGAFAFFYHSWFTHLLEDRLFNSVKKSKISPIVSQINAFERQLTDDGVTMIKFWIHLSNKELKSRLKKYANDPLQSWRVRPEDWQQEKNYEQYTNYAEEMIIQTSTGYAPWILIEGDNQRYAQVKVLTQMVASITAALDRKLIQVSVPAIPAQIKLNPGEPDLLGKIDLNLSLSKEEYKEQLLIEQAELRKLQMTIYQQQIPVLILCEGWDAAGKGGAIKRLTDILDPRSYFVQPFAAPNDEEKARHYLWRFWRKLPTDGTIAIFDRSWYGRVLVERVEGFANESEWRRAYQEINEFESQLTYGKYVLVKLWVHISYEEQLKRFQQRENDQFKQYKLTDEDWRNREKWPLYEVAVNQAIQRTSTPNAPWTIIPGNDKYYARIKVIQTVIQAIKLNS